jgi:hypothetical protein
MAEQWKTDYDQRQYALIQDHLRRHEEGEINLGSLIAGLGTLIQCLEAPDQHWKNAFLGEWGVLEEVHAVALYRVEQGVAPNIEAVIREPDNQRLIRETIENIRCLLADRITGKGMTDTS